MLLKHGGLFMGLAKLLRRVKWKNGLNLQVQDQPGYKVRLCYF